MTEKNTTGSSQGAFAPEPRVYELGYLLMPSVDEGDLSKERDALVALITKYQGIVIDEGQPVLIDLAYAMDKMINNKKHTFTQGYFGWIKFDVAPTETEAFAQEVEAFGNLIRSLLIKTVRENTLTSDQPFKLAKSTRGADQEGDDLSDEEVNEDVQAAQEEVSVDDFTKIEGIGPVIAKTLNEAGLRSFADLADAQDADVQEMIKGVRGNHDSGTWNEQAALARDGKFDELKEMQDKLKGGVEA
jgi:predicted flap endonuclease-1-like 5' DNA nuclease